MYLRVERFPQVHACYFKSLHPIVIPFRNRSTFLSQYSPVNQGISDSKATQQDEIVLSTPLYIFSLVWMCISVLICYDRNSFIQIIKIIMINFIHISDGEVEKLKRAVEALMQTNSEKVHLKKKLKQRNKTSCLRLVYT